MKLTLFSFTGFDTNVFYLVFIPIKLTLFSSTGFDTNEINLVFMHGILTVKVKVSQGYVARITLFKPSDCWQSTRSKVVRNTEMINL